MFVNFKRFDIFCGVYSLEWLEKHEPGPVPEGYCISVAYTCLVDCTHAIYAAVEESMRERKTSSCNSGEDETHLEKASDGSTSEHSVKRDKEGAYSFFLNCQFFVNVFEFYVIKKEIFGKILFIFSGFERIIYVLLSVFAGRVLDIVGLQVFFDIIFYNFFYVLVLMILLRTPF